MDVSVEQEFTAYFKDLGLTEGQVTTLVDKILEYEEVEELAYELGGLLHGGSTYDTIIDDLQNERFGWNTGQMAG